MLRLLGNARLVLPVSQRVAEIKGDVSPDIRIRMMYIGDTSAEVGKRRGTPAGTPEADFVEEAIAIAP